MPFPKTLNARPKVIFFTDFDGTITLQDTNDYITINYGCGRVMLEEYTEQIALGTFGFRTIFQQEVDTWQLPLPKILEIMKRDIRLDPDFKEFVIWAKAHDVPIIVLSSGMKPIIRTMLNHLVGEELMGDVEIVSNDVQLRAPGNSFERSDGWTVKFHDDSSFGHDKSLEIKPYAKAIAEMDDDEEKPTLLYAGDGISDLSAARETDLLFAKAGKDLVNYCEREGIPFVTFKSWKSILEETKKIYEGKKSVRKLAEEGLKKHRTHSMTNGVTNGMTNGSTNGLTNGVTNGITNGTTNGMANGVEPTVK